jgi:hypothetical protein
VLAGRAAVTLASLGRDDRETEELPEPGPLPKGKYTTDELEPAFTFEIEERG